MSDEPTRDARTRDEAASGADAAPGRAGETPGMDERIPGYRIVRKLGEGGMGVVFEAEQESPRRAVALKVIRGGAYVDEQQIRLFVRETQALGQLRHAGIAAIYEAGRTSAGRHFFSMEIVHGAALDEHLVARAPVASGGRPEIAYRLGLFLQICDAIGYAHQRGVIHRDLKPSNIHIVENRPHGGAGSAAAAEQVKVLDFGLARVTDSDVSVATLGTEVGRIQGTLAYMSPEQTRGNPADVDLRSDVYSLGVVLCEMLTGELPYDVRGVPLPVAVRTIAEQEPRRPGGVVRALRGDLETIVLRALEKEPERRYQSVAALADDIRRYLANQPILARPQSTIYQVRKLAARHRAAATLLVALFAVLTASTIMMAVLYQGQSRARANAVLAARKAESVNAFLQDMLASADPERAQGREVTVEMMLDEAASRIDTSFVGEPDVQAELRRTIGKTYASLGQLPPAEEQLRQAIETRRSIHGDAHPEVAKSLGDLATVLNTKGAYAEAESVTRAALAIVSAATPGDAEEARHLDVLGFTAKRDARYAESESLYLSALAIERRLHGRAHPSISTTLGGLASLYEIQGKFTAAESLYREMQAIEREVLGDGHPSHAVTANNLAVLLDKQGRYAEAESLYREAIERGRVLYGGPHPLLASRLFNLGVSLRKLGRHDEAIASHQEALAMQRIVYGEEHQGIARGMAALSMALSLAARHAEAESLGRAALAMRKRLYRPGHDEITRGIVALAQVTRRAGRPAEAAQLFREAADGFIAVFGPENRDAVVAVQGLAESELDLGHYDIAESLFLEALRVRRKLEGEDHPLVGGVLWGLGNLKTQLGDSAAAEPLLREALAIWERKLPATDARLTDVTLAHSRVLESLGRGAEAESVVARRREVIAALSPPPAAETQRIVERLDELRRGRR